MNNKKRTVVFLITIALILAIAGSLLSLYGCKRSLQNNEDFIKADAEKGVPALDIKQEYADNKVIPAAGSPVAIKVSFKLDPRITRGTYMGDRWVSPSTYTNVQDGKTCTVEARAVVLDARGRPTAISPQWVPADSEMVTVLPNQGNMVKITVQGAGRSKLTVISQGFVKELLIKATYENNAIEVEISQ